MAAKRQIGLLFLLAIGAALGGCQPGNKSKKTKIESTKAAQKTTKNHPIFSGSVTYLHNKDAILPCKTGANYTEFCKSVFVTVDAEDNIIGLQQPTLINSGDGYKVSSTESKKTADRKVTISFKHTPKHRGAKIDVIFIFNQEPEDIVRTQIQELQNAFAGNPAVNIEIANHAGAAERLATAQNSPTVTKAVAIVVGGQNSLARLKQSTSGLNKVDLIALRGLQINKENIENKLMKDYLGEVLHMAYEVPYKNKEIDIDSLTVKIGNKIVPKNSIKTNYSDEGADDKNLAIQITHREIFKKYSDEVRINFSLSR